MSLHRLQVAGEVAVPGCRKRPNVQLVHDELFGEVHVTRLVQFATGEHSGQESAGPS
jgi:hypothetical protein